MVYDTTQYYVEFNCIGWWCAGAHTPGWWVAHGGPVVAAASPVVVARRGDFAGGVFAALLHPEEDAGGREDRRLLGGRVVALEQGPDRLLDRRLLGGRVVALEQGPDRLLDRRLRPELSVRHNEPDQGFGCRDRLISASSTGARGTGDMLCLALFHRRLKRYKPYFFFKKSILGNYMIKNTEKK